MDWRVSKHLQKGLSLPFLFFDHRARLSCSGRPASAVLVPFGNEAQLPQWLYAVWHFSKKVLWLPETTRHRLSASLTRSDWNIFCIKIKKLANFS